MSDVRSDISDVRSDINDVHDVPWQRLSGRIVWLDVAVSVISLVPGIIAIWVIGVELTWGALWPVVTVAVIGVAGAVLDIIRWAFTRFRVTATEIERRTGLFVRHHRTLHRDRIRSVDTTAKLRHRIAGLRIVTIGAGQQTGAGESALVLDALTLADATALRERLLSRSAHAEAMAEPSAPSDDSGRVLASFRAGWVVFNMFNIWAYLMAAGLLWGAAWLAPTFGIDFVGMVLGLVDWEALGWVGITLIALIACGVIGAVGLGIHFLIAYGNFELSRVRTDSGAYLRTRRGLLSTREISRDESRIRGMSIGEPLLWRWMGMADTNIITTGLNVWDPEEPTAILPRGPIRVARRVAREYFHPLDPFAAPLVRHPKQALRRRLWWATGVAAVAPALLVVPIMVGAAPGWLLWLPLALWLVAMLGAVISYYSLGHAIAGAFFITRSGLFSRTTSALRRDAVSTIAVSQSVLQRRLGLSTVHAMTAAGWSAYEAVDVDVADAVHLADAAAPGILDEFVDRRSEPERR